MIGIIAAASITSNYVCWMETAAGQVVNLEHLCGGSATPVVRGGGFLDDVSSVVSVTFPGAETRLDSGAWDAVAIAQDYCQLRGQGFSKDDYYARVADRILGDGVMDEEAIAVVSASVQFAPEYFCPQFAD